MSKWRLKKPWLTFKTFYQISIFERAQHLLADLEYGNSRLNKIIARKSRASTILVTSLKLRLYVLDEPIGGVDAARDYILNTIINNYHQPLRPRFQPTWFSILSQSLDEIIFP